MSAHACSQVQEDEEESLLSSSSLVRDSERLLLAGGNAGGTRANFALLDRALEDSLGSARYQKKILWLAMLANFCSVSNDGLLPLIMVELKKDWGVNMELLASVHSAAAVGRMLGSLFFGMCADRFGRASLFGILLTCLLLTSLASASSPSLLMYAICFGTIGFTQGGIHLITTSLIMESTPTSQRAEYMLLSNLSISFAHLAMSAFAFALFPSVGWRWCVRIQACVTLVPIVFSRSDTEESLRFRLIRGEHAKCVSSLQKIAEMNEAPYPWYFTKDALDANCPTREQSSTSQKCRLMSHPPDMRVLAPVLLVFVQSSFSVGVLSFLGMEIRKAIGENAQFTTALVQGFSGLTGTLVTLILVQVFHRVALMRFAAFVASIATYSLALGHIPFFLFLSVSVLTTFLVVFVGALNLYTPEMFPTKIRASVLGICHSSHAVVHIVGPFLAAGVAAKGLMLTGLVYGSMWLVTCLFTFLLFRKDDAEFQEVPSPEESVLDGNMLKDKSLPSGDAAERPVKQLSFEI